MIWTDITPALVNDQQASREVAEVAAGLGHNIQIVTDRPLSLGGDNFAEFLRQVPGCYAYLGTSNPPAARNTEQPAQRQFRSG